MRRLTLPTADVVVCAETDALLQTTAGVFVRAARESIAARGRFAVALSGGGIAEELYELLASNAFAGQIDWPNVYCFWGDERFVPASSPQSNFGMACATLLDHVPIDWGHVYPVSTGEGSGELAAAEYEENLRDFFGGALPQFDLIHLGMGANAHTASLFPHTPALHERSRWVVAQFVEEIKAERITMTVPVLNAGREVIFLLNGEAKAQPLNEVLCGPSDPERLPAQLIRPTTGKATFYVDEAAASRLTCGASAQT